MAENKKDSKTVIGKKVEIFLNTPLFRFKYMMNQEEMELLENAVRISGQILEETAAGFLIKVDVISNMKQKQTELPFEEVLIPYSKVDFVVVR